MIRRDWSAALAAHQGKPCRVCLSLPRELAHVIPRAFDRQPYINQRRVVTVHPLAVVPLCKHHHLLYDSHRLDLHPYLTADELAFAVARVGEGDALRRIRGRVFLEDVA